MAETYKALLPESIGIADLGCSSGFNTLRYIKMLVGGVEGLSGELRQALPEFRVCLNDLPTNDFNTIFQALPNLLEELKKGRSNDEAPLILVAAYPGNFYHRLFPKNSLHFAFSFSSLHWLSRVTLSLLLLCLFLTITPSRPSDSDQDPSHRIHIEIYSHLTRSLGRNSSTK